MRAGGRWLGLGLAGALLATAFACRQIVGIGDAPPGAGPASPTCGGLEFPGLCGQCIAAHCCDESERCHQYMSCDSYDACLAKCDGEDLQCSAQCTVDDVIGTPLDLGAVSASDLRSCLGTWCASDCNLVGCEHLADYLAPPDQARECGSCVETHLCDPVSVDAGVFVPDASNATLELFTRCTVACTTPDCQQSCGAVIGASGDVGIAFGSCGNQCGEGEYWACLDKFGWPSALASQCELQFDVGPQYASATTTVCTRTVTGECTATLADASVNEAGYAVLNLPLYRGSPTPGPGSNGEYVDLSMPNDDAGTLVPTLTYWGFPLSQPHYEVGTVVLQRDDLNALLDSVDAGALAGHGHMAVFVYDCRGAPAKNVTVELPTVVAPETVAFNQVQGGGYVYGNVTQYSNVVTFANVPANPNVVVSATIAGSEKPIATLPVVVRDGAITVVNIIPQPPE
jgi:hypothetical protein